MGFRLSGQSSQHVNQYSFVVSKKGTRSIWLQKEESKHFYDKEDLGMVMPILQICQGDQIKISVNLYSSKGLVQLSSLSFPKI